jgi:NAD-dependent SIR2 family protein deacetylase
MTRYIDADKLHYKKIYASAGYEEKPVVVVFAKEIDKQNHLELAPIIHAHWDCIENVISYEGTFDAYECSHCHKSFLDDLCENNGSDYVDAKKDFEYCPFCGAKMDEETKEKK